MARQDGESTSETSGGRVDTWRASDPLNDPLTGPLPGLERDERDELDQLAVFTAYPPLASPATGDTPSVGAEPWLQHLAAQQAQAAEPSPAPAPRLTDRQVNDRHGERRANDRHGERRANDRHGERRVNDRPGERRGHGLTADALTSATLLRRHKPRPRSGPRRLLYRLTGGLVNLGPSQRDRREDHLLALARTPIVGCHRLAVISLKGGVGKTTTTAALGAMFAELRGDRVIAVDANPDRGTLAERVPRESAATIRDLLQNRHLVTRYADVRAYTSQSPNRLEVLASDADPAASQALSEQDYREAIDILERFYNLIITDCGTGLLHGAMQGVLGVATSLVVVSSASIDGARSASATLDWLEKHGMEQLARDAVVVVSSVRPGSGKVDLAKLEDHFAARCRDVVAVPYDPHLEAGGLLDMAELAPATVDAYRNLAAAVGEGFAISR